MANNYIMNINSENLNSLVKKRENELTNLIEEYMSKYYKMKIDKMGNLTDDNNQYLVSTFFFKSINPIPNIEPIYNSEQLSVVWEFYMKIIEKINMEITVFPPTLSHFAKFAGISLEKLKSFKYDLDENMRILYEKIDNEVLNANLLLSQNKRLVSKPTEFRLKTENEAVEKKTPNVNISLNTKTVDLDKMTERLAEINILSKKQIKYEGK